MVSRSFVAAIVLLSVVLAMKVSGAPQPPTAEKLNPQITELQQERVRVLSAVVEALRLTLLASERTSSELMVTFYDALEELHVARMDMTKDQKQRVALQTEFVNDAKALEKELVERAESRIAILMGKARRMQAEIALLKLQQGGE